MSPREGKPAIYLHKKLYPSLLHIMTPIASLVVNLWYLKKSKYFINLKIQENLLFNFQSVAQSRFTPNIGAKHEHEFLVSFIFCSTNKNE